MRSSDDVLLVGHSEGGMYALLVAESVSPRPAGLALIEPQPKSQRILRRAWRSAQRLGAEIDAHVVA